MTKTNVVVLGAGVIGLSAAVLLAKDSKYSVTIVAQHMPGDYDISYASPWAGADYSPIGEEGSLLQKFEKDTWPHFEKLARRLPEAGLHFQGIKRFNRKSDFKYAVGARKREILSSDPWYSTVLPDFRRLPPSELPTGFDVGIAFTTVSINTAIYLPWLASQALKLGVKIRRAIVSHVSEAADLHASGQKADVVVNATGLGARKLGGVKDLTVGPARGQTVLVRNDPGYLCSSSGSEGMPYETTYVITRAAGGGTILGGCYQKGEWESQPDMNLANRIMKGAVELCPELVGEAGTKGLGISPAIPDADGNTKAGAEKLSVVRHNVGLRPLRDDGPRVEREVIEGQAVVHAYGHGGAGYQSSWGTAEDVLRLVAETAGSKAGKAKL